MSEDVEEAGEDPVIMERNPMTHLEAAEGVYREAEEAQVMVERNPISPPVVVEEAS